MSLPLDLTPSLSVIERCIVVCCSRSALQCVAMRNLEHSLRIRLHLVNMSQCIAVYCSRSAVRYLEHSLRIRLHLVNMSQCIAVHCSAVQCVTLNIPFVLGFISSTFRSALQCIAMCYSEHVYTCIYVSDLLWGGYNPRVAPHSQQRTHTNMHMHTHTRTP